jgi:hypothetical protein
MANIHTGEVRNWDDLSEAQRASGDWIKIEHRPDSPLLNEPPRARRRSVLDDIRPREFTKRSPESHE